MFDNLPSLTKEKAFHILSLPLSKLSLSSDYYKAVFHLLKYPGDDTEKILISFLESISEEQSVLIAKRKALEVLARLNSRKAMGIIGRFLNHQDPLMVERAAWALQELNCQDSYLLNLISLRLHDLKQNRRVLIQALANLSAVEQLPSIRKVLDYPMLSNGDYGATIAAIAKLSGKKFRFKELERLLRSRNQNDRQFAIQDVIDARGLELLPAVLNTPVSPYFRIRAVEKLWPIGVINYEHSNVIDMLDTLFLDHPKDIYLKKLDQNNLDLEYLIEQLFSTEFNRCYSSLNQIIEFSSSQIWSSIKHKLDLFQKDYGALYFLFKLFELAPDWPKAAIPKIIQIIERSIESEWPDFIKFRPAAILPLIKLNPVGCDKYIIRYLDSEKTHYWASRYSALLGIEIYLKEELKFKFINQINRLKDDVNRFVVLKSESISRSFLF